MQGMKIIIDMPDFRLDSTQGEIIKEWIETLKNKRETDIPNPFRFAKAITFEENE
jgi:hypothetical protein